MYWTVLDKSTKDLPKYKIGNLGMLHSKNLLVRWLTKIFDYKMLELVYINKVISPMTLKLKPPEL
jgi:hypothetical protein